MVSSNGCLGTDKLLELTREINRLLAEKEQRLKGTYTSRPTLHRPLSLRRD